jgi:transcriptional antiterminator NusG
MNYYVIQVKTRGEKEYLDRAQKRFQNGEVRLLWPRRNLRIRRRGEWLDTVSPIFPSYLFLEAEEVTPEMYEIFRKIPGFYHFLPNNRNITPLSENDRTILMHFLSFGEIVDKSVVMFDRDKRIRVISGPLKGMEGRIVKVDRRKQRARVKLDMYENSFLIDFGFEALDNIGESR